MRQPLIGLVHGPAYHAHDRSLAFMRADALTSGRKASRSVHPSGASRRKDFKVARLTLGARRVAACPSTPPIHRR